jgi:hypothetical protein
MKKRTIKKSKKTIEKEPEAMVLLADAVKLFYGKRFLSANTLLVLFLVKSYFFAYIQLVFA